MNAQHEWTKRVYKLLFFDRIHGPVLKDHVSLWSTRKKHRPGRFALPLTGCPPNRWPLLVRLLRFGPNHLLLNNRLLWPVVCIHFVIHFVIHSVILNLHSHRVAFSHAFAWSLHHVDSTLWKYTQTMLLISWKFQAKIYFDHLRNYSSIELWPF